MKAFTTNNKKRVSIASAATFAPLALDANIQYSGLLNKVVDVSTSQAIDLDGDSTMDATFFVYQGKIDGFNIYVEAADEDDTFLTTFNDELEQSMMLKMSADDTVTIDPVSTTTSHGGWINLGTYGDWQGNDSGYLGFDFELTTYVTHTKGDSSITYAESNDHYGWVQVATTDSGTANIIDWAFNTTPGEGITVGAVPESSLTGLAVAAVAAGYVVRKRMRTSK